LSKFNCYTCERIHFKKTIESWSALMPSLSLFNSIECCLEHSSPCSYRPATTPAGSFKASTAIPAAAAAAATTAESNKVYGPHWWPADCPCFWRWRSDCRLEAQATATQNWHRMGMNCSPIQNLVELQSFLIFLDSIIILIRSELVSNDLTSLIFTHISVYFLGIFPYSHSCCYSLYDN
jgi:hypothetical protein